MLYLTLLILIRIAQMDGKIKGVSMDDAFPHGSEYYVQPITKLEVDMAVILVADQKWFPKDYDEEDTRFIVKRIKKIDVRT